MGTNSVALLGLLLLARSLGASWFCSHNVSGINSRGINSLPFVAVSLGALDPEQAKDRVKAEASAPLQEAESLLEAGHYEEAESRLATLTKTQASSPQAWFDLGFAESRLGKTSEAVAAYKKAVELSPKWFEANLNLGLTLAKGGNITEAAAFLRSATQLTPASGGQQELGKAWFSLARVLEQSAPADSLAAYSKAAELNPANGDALLGAGKIMEAQGDAAGAEKQYLAAAQSGAPGGVDRLITLYLRQQRLPEAESWLHNYIIAHPNNMESQVQLARTLSLEGKTQDAIAALEKVNQSAPSPVIARALALLYVDARQYGAAAPLLQDLAQKNPADSQILWALGGTLVHQRKYPEAEAAFLQALKLDAGHYDSYLEMAFAAQQNKHYELAIQVLDTRAQHLPETSASYWLRALSYDSLGLFKPAAANYKLFLATDDGKSPDDEFKARHRLKAIEH
jgi:tetratricopeptide (TPR) repeat protein